MLLELGDLELAVGINISLELEDQGKVRNARELVAWLGQQFSSCRLAFVGRAGVVGILNLCVRHDVAVLAFD